MLRAACALLLLAAAQEREFDVRKFGAAGDGKALDNRAIQNAVDACAKAGGGAIRLPPGDYLSGTIVLPGKVRLVIEKDATLRQSRRPEDQPRSALIAAEAPGAEVRNVSRDPAATPGGPPVTKVEGR